MFVLVARSLAAAPVVGDRRKVGQVTWMALANEERLNASCEWHEVSGLRYLGCEVC